MISIPRSILLSVLTTLLILFIGCGQTEPQGSISSPSVSAGSPSPEVVATTTQANPEAIKFKREDGSEAFSIEFRRDGAKLVDGAEAEIARFTRDGNQKIKIKDPNDQTLGYVVPQAGYWKLENADQTQELYILRRQSDGDYKLEDGADQAIYRIKVRDYGFEIETPEKQSLYKVKLKDDKISLRNANDQTVLSTRSPVSPIAVACFGFDVMNLEQQAAMAYAVNVSGGQ